MKNIFSERFILIIFLLTIILVIVITILGSKIPQPQPTPVIQASPSPLTQPQQTIVSTNIRGQTLRVIEPVILNFANPQATPSVSVKIEPEQSVVVKQINPASISIEPERVWRFNTTYALTVTVAGRTFNYTFQTEERRGI